LKVLDVTEFYSPFGGGVRTYLTEKARQLSVQADVEHVIVVSSDRDAVESWQRTRVYRIRGPGVPASPGYHALLSRRKVRDIIQRERPDIIEVGSLYLAPWLVRRAARGVSARLVGFLHEDAHAVYVGHVLARAPRRLKTLANRLITRYLQAAYKGFDLGVAATPLGSETLTAIGLPEVRTVPLGVDTELFHPGRRDATWKAEVGATAQQPVALYVGRFSTEKCIHVVLDALPAIHAATALRLVLIGEGHLRSQLERRARNYPEMLTVLPFESDRSRLARAYASADVFIAPCPYETFGLAGVEAMASGLPVAGVAAAGIGRLLEGVTWGRTYRVGDAEGCARAVRGLLDSQPEELGRRARLAAVSDYSWERTFGTLLDLYRRLIQYRASPLRARRIAPRAAPITSE
jgi:alpha-1,6-mannosyltransferase